jgi:putative tryptophan/tyrosine transport system substrate-binding protein
MKRREFIALLGGAIASPLAARAEPPAIPIVAFFHPGSPERNRHLVAAFRGGLADVGYEEERNVAIEYCWAEDQHDRLPALAENLVRRHPALIVATSTDAVLATSRATSTIPIIFNFASDPVRLGLVASLNRPGKNARVNWWSPKKESTRGMQFPSWSTRVHERPL